MAFQGGPSAGEIGAQCRLGRQGRQGRQGRIGRHGRLGRQGRTVTRPMEPPT
jgi:hypothetical protein